MPLLLMLTLSLTNETRCWQPGIFKYKHYRQATEQHCVNSLLPGLLLLELVLRDLLNVCHCLSLLSRVPIFFCDGQLT